MSQHFQDGLHVIRRSDRYWAGLSSDLVIEQVLMRSIKTIGGLTRGRGMTEQQCVIWSLAMPACTEVNRGMQELTGVSFISGEQNKDMTQVRQARDWKDTQTLQSYLQERNSFTDPSLQSICTRVHAHSTVSVDTAMVVGNAILASMEGKTATDFTFRRHDQVVTLHHCYLESHRSQYWLAIQDSLTQNVSGITREVQFVLDGGSLLQRIPWTRGATYREICAVYTDYVVKQYNETIVVFDG